MFQSKCCGAKGKEDYINAGWKYSYNTPQTGSVDANVPLTCCKVSSGVKLPPTNTSQFYDLPGCLKNTGSPVDNSYNVDVSYDGVRTAEAYLGAGSGILEKLG